MQLSDFYTMTDCLVKYSQVVPEIIASFNRNNASSKGIIAHDPSYGVHLNEDRLEYWDDKHIAYGRYLLFKKTKGEEIKFWTGFCISPEVTSYYIWFDKKYLSTYYSKKLVKKFPPCKSETELWILMKNTSFEDFCNGCPCSISQMVNKFLHSVLKELK